MKLTRSGLASALDKPDPAVRFYLFHGGDESQSRAHGERLLSGLQAKKLQLAQATLKADPALLSSEAAALSLFGEQIGRAHV